MCELLVNLVDKTNSDPYLDVGCYKAGDVITVQEDGWLWGLFEHGNSNWAIVKVPGCAVEEVSSLLVGQVPANPLAPSNMMQIRASGLNLVALGLAPVAGGALVAQVVLSSLSAAQLVKPFLADPNIPTP